MGCHIFNVKTGAFHFVAAGKRKDFFRDRHATACLSLKKTPFQ